MTGLDNVQSAQMLIELVEGTFGLKSETLSVVKGLLKEGHAPQEIGAALHKELHPTSHGAGVSE